MPDNHIVSETSSGTKQFFFDSNTSVAGLFLALTSVGACVTVSRVLVYHYECPGHDRLSTGLERRPATQAPVNGSVSVTPHCAEYLNKAKKIIEGFGEGKSRAAEDSLEVLMHSHVHYPVTI